MTQAVSEAAQPGHRLTFEEFLASIPDDVHAEWEDGEVIYLTVNAQNMSILMFMIQVLGFFVDLKSVGQLFSEPFVMKTGPDLPGRSPDIFFVLTENTSRVREVYLEGPADLVIEIVSPESGTRDRGAKFYEYESGGVREYWLIDAQRKRAEFYVRDMNGLFSTVAPNEDGVYESSILDGFWIKLEWLWQSPLPPVPSVLKDMGLI
jgi:Uma2 family endonuclease